MTNNRLRLLSYLTPGFPVALFERIAAVAGVDLLLDQERSGPAPGHDPFAVGEADLGWLCSTSLVDLATRGVATSVRPVGVAWVPLDPGSGGRAVYFGDVVVGPDSPIERFADLAGRAVGCNDEISLSGHYSFRIEAYRRGLDSTFADLRFTGGHHRSLDLLAGGALDAAVVDSVVRTSRARTDPDVAGLRVVERLGPWPVQPLVARTDLGAEVVDVLRRTLLASNGDPAVRAELAAAGLDRFVAVTPDHYDSVHHAMTQIRSLNHDNRRSDS